MVGVVSVVANSLSMGKEAIKHWGVSDVGCGSIPPLTY